MCPVLYGSKEEHFTTYGYVTPSQAGCLSKNGLALCVEETEVSSSKPQLPSNVVCRPIGSCHTLYGSDPEHFSLYGYITPSQLNCFSHNGVALCVENQNAVTPPPTQITPITKPPITPNPAPSNLFANPPPTIQLPCVPITECRVVFGTMYQHSMYYGEQQACNQHHLKRCVAVEPYVPTTKPPLHIHNHHGGSHGQSGGNTVSSGHHHNGGHLNSFGDKSPDKEDKVSISSLKPHGTYTTLQSTSQTVVTQPTVVPQNYPVLPCVLPSICNEIFGTSYEHFIVYGHQNDCDANGMVKCIDIISMHSSTTQSKLPKDLPYQSVQIVGPKPIYLSLSQIHGPKVSNHFDSSRSTQSKTNYDDDATKDNIRQYIHSNSDRFKKSSDKEEKSNQLYLQGVSLENIFASNTRNYNRRNDQVANFENAFGLNSATSTRRTDKVTKRTKKEVPLYQVLDQVVNTDSNLLPLSGDRLRKPNRYKKYDTAHRTSGNAVTSKQDPEKNKRHYLNLNSFEHLFFMDGGKIKLPYDTNEDSNNYLFFSPKRKLLRKE